MGGLDFDVFADLLGFYVRTVNILVSQDLDAHMEAFGLAGGTGKIATLLLVVANPGIRPSVPAHLAAPRGLRARLAGRIRLPPPQSRALARFGRHRLAAAGLAVILLMVLACWLGPPAIPFDQLRVDVRARFTGPFAGPHLIGTDQLGRDLLVRLPMAGRISLTIGFAAMAISSLIGTAVGLVADHRGGLVGAALMRLVDAVPCFPSVFLLLALAALIRPNVFTLTLIIAATAWMEVARVVEAQIRGLGTRDFALAAELMGASPDARQRPAVPRLGTVAGDLPGPDDHAGGGGLQRRRRRAARHPRRAGRFVTAPVLDVRGLSVAFGGGAARGLRLTSGAELRADAVVVAVGRWTADFAARLGIPLPLVGPEPDGSEALGLLAWVRPRGGPPRSLLHPPPPTGRR